MNKETTYRNSKECYESYISSRVEIALLNLSEDPVYSQIYNEEIRNEESIDILLKKLNKSDRSKVQSFIESLSIRVNMELKESYEQGIRDGIRFIMSLQPK